jgi:lysophospholipase L1-like esterase
MLELGLRLLGAKPETYLRKFSQHHPVLGWVKTPDIEGDFRRGDVKIHEKINSKGLRDSEYEYEKPNHTFRILVLGDSFTEGYDVNFEDLFTEILERRLNDSLSIRTGQKYEVINAGTGGYSTDQEYLFYATEGYKYHPDIVLMMTYAANDIYYNSEANYGNYNKPLFIVKDDSLILSNTPLSKPKQQESVKNIFRDMALYPIVIKTILTSMPAFARTLSEWGFISKSTMEGSVAVNDTSSPKYPSSFSIFAKTPTKKTTAAWKVTERLIRDLKRLISANGSRFVLFSVPDKFQIYPESWEATKIQYKVDDDVWDPQLPNAQLDSITSKYGVPFLNFCAYLKQSGSDQEPLYNGVHWNEKGNIKAADFIFKELDSKGWLKK